MDVDGFDYFVRMGSSGWEQIDREGFERFMRFAESGEYGQADFTVAIVRKHYAL